MQILANTIRNLTGCYADVATDITAIKNDYVSNASLSNVMLKRVQV